MTVADSESPLTREQELEALVHRMQGELAATTDKLTATTAKLASITSERDGLRKAYRLLMEQFELLKRRIFIAKSERVDATQLELEFEKTKKKLDALAQQLGGHAAMADATPGGDQSDAPGARPSGRPPASSTSLIRRGANCRHRHAFRIARPCSHRLSTSFSPGCTLRMT